MITFSCLACQKTLSVNDELAGTMGTCSGCGQMVAIPAPVASLGTAALLTAPSGHDGRTNALTHPPSYNPEPTLVGGKPDTSLTDFLAPPQAEDELGRLGKYRILNILGHGGMGVFKAQDPRLKRMVAIKAMLPTLAASASAGQRFLREAQAMAAIKHDHIVTIHQVDEERGIPFLAMEFLAGEPLDRHLKRDGILPLPEVLRIGREIAEGLDAAHGTGLIHRDVKPSNIWLEAPRNRVKILDFGLARVISQDAGLTHQGTFVGTPAFMAPEQGRGEAVDARCDLFSLGVVLYQLCTGQRPFKGKDTISTLMAVGQDEPPSPMRLNAAVPQDLSDLVMKLLEKDPDRRPASAVVVVEMLQALERKVAQQKASLDNTVELEATPFKRAAVAPRSRRVPLVLAAVLLLGGLIGIGAFTLMQIQSDEDEYVIATDDTDISFRVSKGNVTLEDSKTRRKYNLKVLREDKAEGEQELEMPAADAGLWFKKKTFTIKRGERVALKAWFERKQGSAVKSTVDDGWLKQVAAMPAEKQVEAVAAKLKDQNEGFDGKVEDKIEDGVVTELQFVTNNVTDISPVRALVRLRTLDCSGTEGKGQLADLSPLQGMKLTSLWCAQTKVSDLSPLKDMPLTAFDCHYTKVTDLSPLKDMQLTVLSCYGTKVFDLSPLKDMKLTSLVCGATQVADLSPLKDMQLTYLNCDRTKVADLLPLKRMPLRGLACSSTTVSDLSPLKGMQLTFLRCDKSQVTDLTPLKGMPLKELHCDFKPERDSEILRSIKTLETINGKPAKQRWKEVAAKKQ